MTSLAEMYPGIVVSDLSHRAVLHNDSFKQIFDYLLEDSDAGNLANFMLVAGQEWTGQGGGGTTKSYGRKVHRELMLVLSPVVIKHTGADMIMMPEASEATLHNLIFFLYYGK